VYCIIGMPRRSPAIDLMQSACVREIVNAVRKAQERLLMMMAIIADTFLCRETQHRDARYPGFAFKAKGRSRNGYSCDLFANDGQEPPVWQVCDWLPVPGYGSVANRSASSVRVWIEMSGAGARGNVCWPGLATNAVRIPDHFAPATSHP